MQINTISLYEARIEYLESLDKYRAEQMQRQQELITDLLRKVDVLVHNDKLVRKQLEDLQRRLRSAEDKILDLQNPFNTFGLFGGK